MIKASMGHVRELANDGEDALGFDLGADSSDCRYQPRDDRAKKVVADLRQAVKAADRVYIATDPDREGETIGWHLQQALNLKNPRRVVYSEITSQTVRAAIVRPRTLDQSLVAAGRARDCLDKLVGYTGSRHVVWPLNNGAKSMGRVQSATLCLLCVRSLETSAALRGQSIAANSRAISSWVRTFACPFVLIGSLLRLPHPTGQYYHFVQ